MKRLMSLSTPIVLVMLLGFPLAMLQKKNANQLQANYVRTENPEVKKRQAIENFSSIPLSFEANHGQTASEVNFLSRGSGYNLFLTHSETVLVLSKPSAVSKGKKEKISDVLRMKMVGANSGA